MVSLIKEIVPCPGTRIVGTQTLEVKKVYASQTRRLTSSKSGRANDTESLPRCVWAVRGFRKWPRKWALMKESENSGVRLRALWCELEDHSISIGSTERAPIKVSLGV